MVAWIILGVIVLFVGGIVLGLFIYKNNKDKLAKAQTKVDATINAVKK